MSNVKLDYKNSGITDKEIMKYKEKVIKIHNEFNENANDENAFLGWLHLPTNYDKKEFERIKKAAKRINKTSEIFVVIGIGGSYLGARAVIQSLTNTFYNVLDKKKRKAPQILYAGNNMSSDYLQDLIDYIGDKEISIKNLGEVLSNSINNSISTILLIGGFVVIFSVILSILNRTQILDMLSMLLKPILQIFNIDTDFAKPLLSGIIELTNGVKQVSGIHIKAISQNIILCAFLLGFGGFSVLLQVFSIVSKTDLSMKKYVAGKLMQGILASIYTFLALKFIPFINLDIVEVSNNLTNSIAINQNPLFSIFYDIGITTISIAIVFVILRLFNKVYKKLT